MNEVVPFGKYKGQPIELLAADPQYCDWLASQDWFRERYNKIYTVIINNFAQPEDTPEHNQMQAKFLDSSYTLAFFKTFVNTEKAFMAQKEIDVEFEVDGFDVVASCWIEPKEASDKAYRQWINIELKPCVGDDYPSILRQIKANKKTAKGFHLCCLVYDKFSASGISEENMKKLFLKSHIAIRSTAEIEEMLRSETDD